MVAIKQDLNAQEDLADIGLKIEELTAGLGDDADGSKQAEIGTLETRRGELQGRRQALEGEIGLKTELVTTTGAEALTIASRIANEEAALRLAAAEGELANLDAEDVALQGELESFKVFAQLGDTEAPGNIARIEAVIQANEGFRAEARAAIADINLGREQANRAAAIAEDLSIGTEEAINRVVQDAGPAIQDFTGLRDEAAAAVEGLNDKVERTTASIERLTNSATALTDK
jgi:hypothetical protein